MSYVQKLYNQKAIQPPKWLADNTVYETIMGSVAYGVSSDTSDVDIYGFCIPPKEILFPHLSGDIPGFGNRTNVTPFEQYQQHHINDPDALGGKGRTYDITIYSIAKYFQLCMDNNPNMIDSLFTPDSCVLNLTPISKHIRDSRNIFLHKGAWHKFKGYAYSQVHKIKIKTPQEGSSREAIVKEFGYDVKFAYHVVRLMDEVEQILTTGTLDLQKNREQLKAIRRGEWKEEEILDYFKFKEKSLEEAYSSSKLPHSPDERQIKRLLTECLEMHYGSLQGVMKVESTFDLALKEIKNVLDKYGY